MKKKFYGVAATFAATVLLSSSMMSCATILAKKNAEVVLYGATKSLKVTENGVDVPIELIHSHDQAAGESVITFYAPGIKLDRRVSHTVTLSDNSKTADVVLEAKVSGAWVTINLFTSGPIGMAVDASTKKWKTLKPRFVDVEAALNGTKPMSKRKMKKGIKRSAMGKR